MRWRWWQGHSSVGVGCCRGDPCGRPVCAPSGQPGTIRAIVTVRCVRRQQGDHKGRPYIVCKAWRLLRRRWEYRELADVARIVLDDDRRLESGGNLLEAVQRG